MLVIRRTSGFAFATEGRWSRLDYIPCLEKNGGRLLGSTSAEQARASRQNSLAQIVVGPAIDRAGVDVPWLSPRGARR